MSSQRGEQEEKQPTEGLDQSLTLHIRNINHFNYF